MNKEKTYKLEFLGDTYEIALRKSTYQNNGRTYIAMVEIEDGEVVDLWSDLTVNLNTIMPLDNSNNDMVYIDTNNNSNIIKWLEKNKIGKNTGFVGYSGFCSYPLFKINKEVLDNMLECD